MFKKHQFTCMICYPHDLQILKDAAQCLTFRLNELIYRHLSTSHQPPSPVFYTLPLYGKPDSHFPVRRKQWEWTARPLRVNQHIIVSEENHLTCPAPCSHKASRGKATSTRETRNSPGGHKQLSRWETMTKLEVCPGQFFCKQKPCWLYFVLLWVKQQLIPQLYVHNEKWEGLFTLCGCENASSRLICCVFVS